MVTLEHFGVVVADLAETVTFFQRLFQCDPVATGSWRGTDADYVADMLGVPHGLELEAAFFRLPYSNAILELIQYSGIEQKVIAPAPTDVGAVHIGFYVDSIAMVMSKLDLRLRGVVAEIPYGPCRGGRTAYLHGPGEINLQLMELAQRPGGAPLLTGADFWVDHIGLVVEDLSATVKPLSRLLDSPVSSSAEWRGTDADYVADTLGVPHGLELEAQHVVFPWSLTMLEFIKYSGLPQEISNTSPTDIGAMHIGLQVDSVTGVIEDLGLPPTGRVTQIPYGPSKGGRSVYVRSPDGNHLQLTEVRARPGRLPVLKSARQLSPAT